MTDRDIQAEDELVTTLLNDPALLRDYVRKLSAMERSIVTEELSIHWQQQCEAAEREVGAKQAEIDRLMLEYCPEEMTPMQIEEWRKYQVRVSPEQEAAIAKALLSPRAYTEPK